MNKYENALIQMCLHCKTKPQYCNKKKCKRYNYLKELVDNTKILKNKFNWNKENLKEYSYLLELKSNGILNEFLDNVEEIKKYMESVDFYYERNN